VHVRDRSQQLVRAASGRQAQVVLGEVEEPPVRMRVDLEDHRAGSLRAEVPAHLVQQF
jgi:hypothetical protein